MKRNGRYKDGPHLTYGAERLRDYLGRRELTQKKLAVILGTTEANLSRLLNGIQGPGVALAIRIQEATGGFVMVEDFAREPTSSLRLRMRSSASI